MCHVVQRRRSVGRFPVRYAIPALFGLAVLPVAPRAHAATLCVDPSGGGGCFTRISDAVATAQPGDTINVSAGNYAEDVVIGKAVALIGAGSARTIINAAGQANGIYVDGMDNSGLRSVVVSGFEVKNANFGAFWWRMRAM